MGHLTQQTPWIAQRKTRDSVIIARHWHPRLYAFAEAAGLLQTAC